MEVVRGRGRRKIREEIGSLLHQRIGRVLGIPRSHWWDAAHVRPLTWRPPCKITHIEQTHRIVRGAG